MLRQSMLEAYLNVLLPPLGFVDLNDDVVITLFTYSRNNITPECDEAFKCQLVLGHAARRVHRQPRAHVRHAITIQSSCQH